MRVYFGNDHAGFDLVRFLVENLSDLGFDCINLGPKVFNREDDYPKYCISVGEAVVRDISMGIDAIGVVLGGSGNGEQIAANKVRGVRAALLWNTQTAQLAREHNLANVAAIGARMHTRRQALEIVLTFCNTKAGTEERHIRRITQIEMYESAKNAAEADRKL